MKISVVTVTWNSAATVADTLRSVNAQTHSDVEHLVVDGGSTDTTLEIVRAVGQRVACVVSERDRGIYDAMNKGIRLATGDVVGLLNSDDFYADDRALADVAAAFAAEPALDAVYGDLCYVRPSDTTRIVRYWRSAPFEPGRFARGWAPPHPTLFVRREVYERHGLFDLAYPIAADFELMARLLEVHRVRVRHLPQVLVHMRTGGTTNRSLGNIVRQNGEILRALKQHRLGGSATSFFLSKLLSRGRQFVARPE
ncbi:MAG: glycosyltransferase family 2 protein [Caldimonas sp.]